MRAACSGGMCVCALRACVAESMRADSAYLGACFCDTCGLAAVLAVHCMQLGVRAHGRGSIVLDAGPGAMAVSFLLQVCWLVTRDV